MYSYCNLCFYNCVIVHFTNCRASPEYHKELSQFESRLLFALEIYIDKESLFNNVGAKRLVLYPFNKLPRCLWIKPYSEQKCLSRLES